MLKSKPKLLDVFLFYNELDLLKARLEYLGPTVDAFIISEADVDFSGKEKDFLLSKELISTLPFSEKIIYHREHLNLNSITWLYRKFKYRNRKNRYLWKIQDAQRNSTLKPLMKFNAHDIVIFSDLDEFPSKGAIDEGINLISMPQSRDSSPNAWSLDQTFYYYNLNNAAPREKFYGTVMTDLNTFRKYFPHKFRSGKNNMRHILNGGWHFSYFMDEEKILKKIHAISDVENLSSYKNISLADIQKKILSGTDLYDRGVSLDKEEQKKIPREIIRILKRYLPHCVSAIG